MAAPTSPTPKAFISGLASPYSLAVSPDGQTVYVGDYSTDSVVAYDVVSRARKRVYPLSPSHDPRLLSLGPNGKKLFVLAGAQSARTILEMDLATGACSSRVPARANVSGMDVGPDGTILFTDFSARRLYTSGGVQQELGIVEALPTPPRLVLDQSLSPTVSAGSSWRLPAGTSPGVLSLQASPEGVRHKLVWDVWADTPPPSRVGVRLTPFDDRM
ncbi:YncE family protein, partial [Planctomycetota bacterium]